MSWTLDDVRSLHRAPRAQPRRTIEFGRQLGGVTTGIALRLAFYPEGLLEPALGAVLGSLPPLDPELEPLIAHWRELSTLLIVRDHTERRYGAVPIVGFDAMADEMHEVMQDVVPHLVQLDLDGQRPSDWFTRFDVARRDVAVEREPDVDPSTDCSVATARMLLWYHSRSPVQGSANHPDLDELQFQVAMHAGWIEPVARNFARVHAKQLLRELTGIGSSLPPAPDGWLEGLMRGDEVE